MVYHTPIFNWTKTHSLNSGIDWFLNLKKTPIEVQIGTNKKILMDFELNDTHQLPVLTDNISALTKMNFDENQMTNKYEVLRFLPNNKVSNNDDFQYLRVTKSKNRIQISAAGIINPLQIDLQKRLLIYKKWFTEYSIPLQNIGDIYYRIPAYMGNQWTVKWYLVENRLSHETNFFTFNVGAERNIDMEYIELSFRNEIEKLKAILEEISELSNINIRQENSL